MGQQTGVVVAGGQQEAAVRRPAVELPRQAVQPRQAGSLGATPGSAPQTPRGSSPQTPRGCKSCKSCATPSTACGSTDSSPSPRQAPLGQLRACRFCLEVEEVPFEEEVKTPARACRDAFVDPCPCRGSNKFVHLACLVQHFEAQRSWHNFRCPTCKQLYEGRALRELAKVSRDRMMQEHGPASPQVAHSLCFLAQAHAQLGNTRESREVLEEGLEIAEAHFGRGHVATAAILGELAVSCGRLGEVQKQKELLERSLEIKEKHFGVGHVNTATALNNLATAHSDLGNVQQERVFLERSLEIKEKHFGRGHVQTVAALVNLAGVYSELGEAAKGLELLQWSLEIEERHFGKHHVETAITLNNLALAYGEGGNMRRMWELLTQCLDIKERHYGHEHQELCLTLVNLATACVALGDEASARRLCERAMRVCSGLPSSRRCGLVFLRCSCVHSALEKSLPSELVQRAVTVLEEALGGSAGRRVLGLEIKHMSKIWTAAGHADIPQRVQELCG